MKKVVFLFLSLIVFASASEINWVSYKNYLSMKKDKPAFVFVSSSHCRFCKKAMTNMEGDSSFVSFVNKRFIPVYIVQDKEMVPVHLSSQVTPTFYILDSKEDYLVPPIQGAQPLDYMFRVMNRAEYSFRNQK